jgi:hypothetical protein
MDDSVEKRERDGGCRSRIPWRSVSVLRVREEVVGVVWCPSRCSRVVRSRVQRLWLNVSCRWKNVRNAGSEGRSARVFVVFVGSGVVVVLGVEEGGCRSDD